MLSARGEHQPAVDRCLAGLRKEPRSFYGVYTLGVVYQKAGRWGEALSAFSKAVEINDLDPRAHANLAGAAMRTGDLDRAALHFERMIELNHQVAPAQFNLGVIAARKGSADEAARRYRLSLAADPTFKPAKDALAKIKRAPCGPSEARSPCRAEPSGSPQPSRCADTGESDEARGGPRAGKAVGAPASGCSVKTRVTLLSSLVLVGAAWWLFVGRGRAVQTPSGASLGRLPTGVRPDQLNVLLITLDTTRWDRIGAYGDGSAATPNLDRLAGEGVLFEQAIAPAPLTLPAHSTLFTGLLPPRHGVRDNGGYVLDPKHTTLAKVLKAAGRATGAFVGAFVLDGKFGLDAGFDTYHDKFDLSRQRSVSLGSIARTAGEVVDNAMPWLDRHASAPFFAWLHFYDAHSPYRPPEPFLSRFRDRPYAGRDRVCRFAGGPAAAVARRAGTRRAHGRRRHRGPR